MKYGGLRSGFQSGLQCGYSFVRPGRRRRRAAAAFIPAGCFFLANAGRDWV
jgi:hypothetical protein